MWWRRFLGIDDQSPAEKRASVNGVNLFFGALIGANLGTLESMSLRDYTLIAAIVCMIVLYIQVAPVARRRWSYLFNLGALVAGLYLLLFDPLGQDVFQDRPAPTPHIFVTICLWLVSVALIEFRPIAKPAA
jgi:hypothetical protein